MHHNPLPLLLPFLLPDTSSKAHISLPFPSREFGWDLKRGFLTGNGVRLCRTTETQSSLPASSIGVWYLFGPSPTKPLAPINIPPSTLELKWQDASISQRCFPSPEKLQKGTHIYLLHTLRQKICLFASERHYEFQNIGITQCTIVTCDPIWEICSFDKIAVVIIDSALVLEQNNCSEDVNKLCSACVNMV